MRNAHGNPLRVRRVPVDASVLGDKAAKGLFPDEDPIGKRIRIEQHEYEVIGVFANRKNIFGGFAENFMVIPYTSYERDFRFYRQEVGISVIVDSREYLDEVRENMRSLMRARRKVPLGEPDDFAIIAAELAPFFFANLIDGCVESFDDVESVDDQRDVRAVGFDPLNVGSTHVAAGPFDSALLTFGKFLQKEFINRFPALALADPDDAGAIKIIDNRRELSALQVRDFIDAKRDDSTDFMIGSHASDDSVQLI
jgi:hypothetical protein